MQGRQQAALEPLSEFASQIQARLARLEEHMQAFAELGQAASRLSALLKTGPEGGAALIRDANAQLSRSPTVLAACSALRGPTASPKSRARPKR